MGTGYTRNDTVNNIADGNVINASDLDGEFDAIQSAFNGTTGHSHDGTTGEGPQIAAGGIASNAITTAKILDANVTTAKIADSNITTAKILDANVTLAKMAANSVDSDQYVDGSIDSVHLAADIVDGTKIADDSIDSEHYVDGSIDTAHIADNAVTLAKLEDRTLNHVLKYTTAGAPTSGTVDTDNITDNAVTLAKLEDRTLNHVLKYTTAGAPTSGTVDTDNITNSAVTTAKIAADAIDGTKIADDSIDSEHYVDGSIDTAHIADDAVTSAKLDTNIQVAGTLGVTGETTLTTHLNMGDNDIIKLGDSADLQIYHDGSNSYVSDEGTGNLIVRASNEITLGTTAGEDVLKGVTNGAVTLYYDNSAKLATKSDGVDITGELQSDSLDVDGVANISGVLTMQDHIDIPDNKNLRFGAGSDLVMFHDAVGGGSYINESGTGDLNIQAIDIIFKKYGTSEVFADFNADGAVELYYDANKKFETTTGGIAVTGAITATGDITAFYTSDETLKTNIENIENATDKVMAINGVRYNWTDEAQANYEHLDDSKEIGVIAQQVEKVAPEIVKTREDGTKAVQYERLCALLIESIKELKQEINELKGV